MDLNELNRQLLVAEEEIKLLKGGKKVSATRARQALLHIKKQSDLVRKEILENTRRNKPVKEVVEKELHVEVNDVKHHEVDHVKQPKKKKVK